MNVAQFAEKIGARLVTSEAGADRQVSGVYACDLLSWAMSHSSRGDAWITVHTNMNVVAVAVLAEIACVVIPEGIDIEQSIVDKAIQEGIPILATSHSVYKICCMAYEAGIV